MAEPAAFPRPAAAATAPPPTAVRVRPRAHRTSPHSVEAEEYLLGCCLLDGADSIARCLEAKLAPEAFYSAANRIIYEKLCELYQKSPPVAIEVLAEELKTSRQLEAVGGYAYLSQLSSRIPTTAQAQYFIERVRELHLLRELIKVATATVENCLSFRAGSRSSSTRSSRTSSRSPRTASATRPSR